MVFIVHYVEKMFDLLFNGNDPSYLYLVFFWTFKPHLVGATPRAKKNYRNFFFSCLMYNS
jgi:hypothetical protein